MSSDPIVTVTRTVMDGVVVRWFDNLAAAKRFDPLVSASRNRVERYRLPIPPEWLTAAAAAHKEGGTP
jgi:hypothetical protein